MFKKLYKRNGAWVCLQDQRFVVVAEWMGQERVVYAPTSPWDDVQEQDCVRYCLGL